MNTRKQPSKTDDDITFRPLIRLSRARHGGLIELLEQVPQRALGFEIARRLVKAYAVEVRSLTLHTDSGSIHRPSDALSKTCEGVCRESVLRPTMQSQTKNTAHLAEYTENNVFDGLARMGIRSKDDFEDAFDWTKP